MFNLSYENVKDSKKLTYLEVLRPLLNYVVELIDTKYVL